MTKDKRETSSGPLYSLAAAWSVLLTFAIPLLIFACVATGAFYIVRGLYRWIVA